jgi:hypothetical protein
MAVPGAKGSANSFFLQLTNKLVTPAKRAADNNTFFIYNYFKNLDKDCIKICSLQNKC